MKKYLAWFKQAENDFRWACDSMTGEHYAQVCFISQQVAEKCLKSIAYYRGHDFVKSHSLVNILKELKINGDLKKAGMKLDLYYISTRYPDALPEIGVPSDFFCEDQAKEALDLAQLFLDNCFDTFGT